VGARSTAPLLPRRASTFHGWAIADRASAESCCGSTGWRVGARAKRQWKAVPTARRRRKRRLRHRLSNGFVRRPKVVSGSGAARRLTGRATVKKRDNRVSQTRVWSSSRQHIRRRGQVARTLRVRGGLLVRSSNLTDILENTVVCGVARAGKRRAHVAVGVPISTRAPLEVSRTPRSTVAASERGGSRPERDPRH
jgi:hypothetical protein